MEYALNGEDPVILPADNPKGKRFSAIDYAQEIAGNICENLENQQKKMAVLALSKDEELPKDKQISDSLARIKKLPKEVWAVKLADRITNLQPPPAEWTTDKNSHYAEDARIILDELREGNPYLAERLDAKISEYTNRNREYLTDMF